MDNLASDKVKTPKQPIQEKTDWQPWLLIALILVGLLLIGGYKLGKKIER